MAARSRSPISRSRNGRSRAPRLDQRYLDLQCREHRRVLAADDAAADDDHALGKAIELQDGVGVVDVRIVERDFGRLVRNRAGRDEHELPGHPAWRRPERHDFDRVRIDEARHAADARHVVPFEVPADARDFELADRVLPRQETRHGELRIHLDRQPEQLALSMAREKERRLPQRLRRQRAGVDGGAARLVAALHDEDPLAEVRSLDGAFFASRSRAQHDQVVVVRHGRSVLNSGRRVLTANGDV